MTSREMDGALDEIKIQQNYLEGRTTLIHF